MFAASTDAALSGVSSWVQTVASLLAVTLALWGIKIAAQTARDQRDNRDFGPQKTAADEFELALAALLPEKFFLGDAEPNATRAFSALGEAQTRFTSAVQDLTIGGYFTSRSLQIIYTVRDSREGQLSFAEACLKVSSTLSAFQRVARHWPYPERRGEILDEIYEWMIENHYSESAVLNNRRLQIARWMHSSYPSPSRARQAITGWWLWLRVAAYDVRHRRAKQRIEEWRIGRQEVRAARAKWGKPSAPRKSNLPSW